MKLKSTDSVNVEIAKDGKIFIQQFFDSTHNVSEIYLTPEQFKSIENWVFKNRDEIESTSYGGVENDNES